jgi:hypothetical protein
LDFQLFWCVSEKPTFIHQIRELLETFGILLEIAGPHHIDRSANLSGKTPFPRY